MYRHLTFGEFYLNHVCLGNINIDKEMDARVSICYTLNALMAYRLNALMVLPQSSVSHREEHLDWSLLTQLPYMVQ